MSVSDVYYLILAQCRRGESWRCVSIFDLLSFDLLATDLFLGFPSSFVIDERGLINKSTDICLVSTLQPGDLVWVC
jgi:hypothetical protein